MRVTLGTIFLTTGVVKFGLGLGNFAGATQQQFAGKLPVLLITPFAYSLPFLEVTVGALLVIGLFNVTALVLSGLLLLALTFAADGKSVWTCSQQGQLQGWDLSGKSLGSFRASVKATRLEQAFKSRSSMSRGTRSISKAVSALRTCSWLDSCSGGRDLSSAPRGKEGDPTLTGENS